MALFDNGEVWVEYFGEAPEGVKTRVREVTVPVVFTQTTTIHIHEFSLTDYIRRIAQIPDKSHDI